MDLTEATPSGPTAGRTRSEAGAGAAEPASRWPAYAVAGVVALGVVVRFVTVSHLWLDEAQTVAIASLPLDDIPEGLRHDGAPPLFYVLLHGWMKLFGSGELSVRFLPGVFAVAALPLAWLAARRLAGTRVAWAAVLLLASSPFAVRYATEARMYSLMVLLVLVGYLAVQELLDRPSSIRAAVGVALVTGLLLLTHYWSIYLLFVVGVVLLTVARRGPAARRDGARRGVVAMGLGSLAFLPWVPVFLYQLRNTGTPWGRPGHLRTTFDTLTGFAGGYWDPGLILGGLYFVLTALALMGKALDSRRIEVDLRTRPPGRHLFVVGFGTLVVAILATVIGRSAFAIRYAAVVFPMALLLVALGTKVILDRRILHGVLAVAVAAGFWGIGPNVFVDRTSAPRVAAALEAGVVPGDVVAYCPDQLGPSVSRLLPDGIDQLTFPRGTSPHVVDWVDYAETNEPAEPAPFAQMLVDRAGPDGTVWLVWAPGYRTYKAKCPAMIGELDELRPNNTRAVKLPSNFEKPGLVRFDPN